MMYVSAVMSGALCPFCWYLLILLAIYSCQGYCARACVFVGSFSPVPPFRRITVCVHAYVLACYVSYLGIYICEFLHTPSGYVCGGLLCVHTYVLACYVL